MMENGVVWKGELLHDEREREATVGIGSLVSIESCESICCGEQHVRAPACAV